MLLLGSLPEPVHHGIKSKKRMGARSLAVLSGYRDLLEPASLPNCSQRRRWYSLNSILLKLDMHYCMHLKENGQNLCFWVAKGKWFPSCLLLQTRELLATSSVVWGTRVTVFGRFWVDLIADSVVPVQPLYSQDLKEYVSVWQYYITCSHPKALRLWFLLVLFFPSPLFPDLYVLWLLCHLPLGVFYLHWGQDPAMGLKGSVFISCSTSAP